MSSYKAYIEICVDVDYDFQPEEKQVLYPNEDAYPGCPAEVTINSISLKDVDIACQISAVDFNTLAAEILEYKLNTGDE